MKTSATILSALFLFAAHFSNAQAFDVGTKHLSLGVGFGSYLNYGYYTGSSVTRTPTIFIAYDQGVKAGVGPGIIGFGGFLGYQSVKAKYEDASFNYNWSYRWTDFVIGLRGTYHIPISNDKIDLYGGLGLGLYNESFNYKYDGYLPDDSGSGMFFYYAFAAGAKYMFTDNIGAFVEAGYDIAYLKAGLTLSLGGGGGESTDTQ